jgi:hypothetical protein
LPNPPNGYYQHFTNPVEGGVEDSYDFCPIYGSFRNVFCSDPKALNVIGGHVWGQTFSDKSACFNIVANSDPVAGCFETYCVRDPQHNINITSIAVAVGASWRICPLAGGRVSFTSDGNDYELDCPNVNVFCAPWFNMTIFDLNSLPIPSVSINSMSIRSLSLMTVLLYALSQP